MEQAAIIWQGTVPDYTLVAADKKFMQDVWPEGILILETGAAARAHRRPIGGPSTGAGSRYWAVDCPRLHRLMAGNITKVSVQEVSAGGGSFWGKLLGHFGEKQGPRGGGHTRHCHHLATIWPRREIPHRTPRLSID